MDTTLSTRPPRKYAVATGYAGMRYVHENPPTLRRNAFVFGLQEVFTRKYGMLINVEAAPIDGPPGDNFYEVTTGFIERARKFSSSLERQACAFWSTNFASVTNCRNEKTQIPLMHCVMLAPNRLVAYCFEALTDELDDEENRHLSHLAIAASRLMPAVSGNSTEQQLSHALFETIREGLSTGFECTESRVRPAYYRGN